MQSILIVEDRPALRQVYATFLRSQDYMVLEAGSVEEARKAVDQQEFDLILSDYMLPGASGLDFLRELNQREVESLVIIMTAFGEVKLAVSAIKDGAFDFLEKPIDLEYLKHVVGRAMDHKGLLLDKSFKASRSEPEEHAIIGESPALKAALDLVDKVAPSQANCLLTGESGVGKELFAQRIHKKSSRCDAKMVSINCASIPGELMESELFGHEKGAFTGAVGKKVGLVEMANGGTLFLDEIGELNLDLQPKLLRVLQSREFYRVGGNRVLSADIRVVCATNRDLVAGVRDGWFREDLYYRLASFPIEIPPLRDRVEDLELLVPFFLERKGYLHGPLDQSLMALLSAYGWPGNVRELENLLDRAVILCRDQPLGQCHFPQDVFQSPDRVSLAVELNLQQSFKENMDQLEPQIETDYIRRLLALHGGSREQVARTMGISIKTLYNHIKRLGL